MHNKRAAIGAARSDRVRRRSRNLQAIDRCLPIFVARPRRRMPHRASEIAARADGTRFAKASAGNSMHSIDHVNPFNAQRRTRKVSVTDAQRRSPNFREQA